MAQDFGINEGLNKFLAEYWNFDEDFRDGNFDRKRTTLTPEENALIDQQIASYGQSPGVQTLNVAGFTPYQQEALYQMGQGSGAIDPRIGSAIDRSNTALDSATAAIDRAGASYDYNSYLPFMNPYIDEVINRNTDNINRQYDVSRNNIDEAFAEAGGFGSTAQGVERSLNTEARNRQIGDMDASLRAQGFDQAQGNALNLYNQNRATDLARSSAYGNIAAGSLNTGSAYQGLDSYGRNVRQNDLTNQLFAGDRIQAQNQLGLDAYIAERDRQLQYPYQQTTYLQGVLGSYPTGGGTTTSTTPGVGTLQGAVGGAALGYGLQNQFGGNNFTANPYVNSNAYSGLGGTLPWLNY